MSEVGSNSLHSTQTIRFARPNSLFYDEHIIDLYHRVCGLYLIRRRYRNKGKIRTAIRPWETSHETRFVLGGPVRNLLKKKVF